MFAVMAVSLSFGELPDTVGQKARLWYRFTSARIPNRPKTNVRSIKYHLQRNFPAFHNSVTGDGNKTFGAIRRVYNWISAEGQTYRYVTNFSPVRALSPAGSLPSAWLLQHSTKRSHIDDA